MHFSRPDSSIRFIVRASPVSTAFPRSPLERVFTGPAQPGLKKRFCDSVEERLGRRSDLEKEMAED
jgi:hypothetical protein